MKGVVEVYRGEEKILEESNMLMDNLGSQIAFWMSLPRGFEEIPSAASIYDASNYTVRAASLGKDAAGYNHHAHGPLVSPAIASDGIFRVLSFEGTESKSYRTEKFATYYNDSSGVSAIVARQSEILGDNIVLENLALVGSNWVNNGGGSFSALSVNTDQNALQNLRIYCPAEKGKLYKVNLLISNYVSGDIGVGLNGSYTPYVTPTGNGILSFNLAAGNSTSPFVSNFLFIRGRDNFKAVVSNITTQELSSVKVRVLPEYSHPKQQRLESQSTRVASVVKSNYDYGHNVNLTISGNNYKPAGCYAPPESSTYYLLSSLPDGRVAQAAISNTTGFNSYIPGVGEGKSIDSRGFIRVLTNNLTQANAEYQAGTFWKKGLNISTGNVPLTNTYDVLHTLGITKPDFICLNFFGGIYTVGLWGYDIEKMLEKGMTPPFSQYDIEDIDYKLFARKTFNKDLTYYEGTSTSFSEIETLKIIWRFKFIT